MTDFISWICWKLKWGWELDYERFSDGRFGYVLQLWINRKTGEKKERTIRWRG